MAYQIPNSGIELVPAISSHALSFLTYPTENNPIPPPTPGKSDFYPVYSTIDMQHGCPLKKKQKDHQVQRIPVMVSNDQPKPPLLFDDSTTSSSPLVVKAKKEPLKIKKVALKFKRQKQRISEHFETPKVDYSSDNGSKRNWNLKRVDFTFGQAQIDPFKIPTQPPVALGPVVTSSKTPDSSKPKFRHPTKSRVKSCPPGPIKDALKEESFIAQIIQIAAATVTSTPSPKLKTPPPLDENLNEPEELEVNDPHPPTHTEDPGSSTTSFNLIYNGMDKVFPSKTECGTYYGNPQDVIDPFSDSPAPSNHECLKIVEKGNNKDTNKNVEESSSSKSAHWLKKVDSSSSSSVTSSGSSSICNTEIETSIILSPPTDFEDSVIVDKTVETNVKIHTHEDEAEVEADAHAPENNVKHDDNTLPVQRIGSCQLLYKPKPLPFSESISRQEYPSMSMVNSFKSTFTKGPGVAAFPSITSFSEVEDEETLLEEIRRSNSLFPVEWIQNIRTKWTRLKNWLLKRNQAQTSRIIASSPNIEQIPVRSKSKYVKERSEYMDRIMVSGTRKRVAIPREMYFFDDGEELPVENLVPEIPEPKEFRRKRYTFIWCDHEEHPRRKYITKDVRPRRIAVRLEENEE